MTRAIEYSLHGVKPNQVQDDVKDILRNAQSDPVFQNLTKKNQIPDDELASLEAMISIEPVRPGQGIVEPGTAAILVSFAAGVGVNVFSDVIVDLWRLYILKRLEEKRGHGALSEN